MEFATSREKEILSDSESKGHILYSGYLYHGRSTNDGDPIDRLETKVDYTTYTIPRDISMLLGESSMTLGSALYLTPIMKEAVNYANRRISGEHPVLHKLEAKNVRMYDFRIQNGTANAHVPLSVAQNWQAYFDENKKIIEERWKQLNNDHYIGYIKPSLESYSLFLQHFVSRLDKQEIWKPMPPRRLGVRNIFDIGNYSKRNLDLRDMLRTIPGDTNWTNPNHGKIWGKFVVEELNCNGIIFNESGDAPHFETAPTFALYKLEPSQFPHQKKISL